MTRQFVLINPIGEEIDWIDPVIYYEETETHWVVDNDFHIYAIEKSKFPGCVARFKVEVTNWKWEDEA